MAIIKGTRALTTIEEWEKVAGPKSAGQWKPERSAMEAARAWLEGKGVELPAEVAGVLAAHPAFGPVQTWEAEPEVQLQFDKFRGETRNSDLVVHAVDAHGPFVMAVEAKADEAFDKTLGKKFEETLETLLENPRSNGVARLIQLSQAFLGPQRHGDPPAVALRYQLLTACAGALCEAERRRCSRALMLVQEFISRETRDENHERNAADLDRFAHRISHGSVQSIQTGTIVGPFAVPGTPLFSNEIHLFIGKVSRNLRGRTT